MRMRMEACCERAVDERSKGSGDLHQKSRGCAVLLPFRDWK